MAYDYTQNKTPIFTDINDQPKSATSSSGSNASDLIDKVNTSLDNLITDFNSVESVQSNQQNTIDDHETRISQNETDISNLQSGVSPSFILDFGNRSNYNWAVNGTLEFEIHFLPMNAPFRIYNGTSLLGVNWNYNGQKDSSIDYVEISNSNIQDENFDFTYFVESNGIGYYIIYPVDVVSGSYSETRDNPNTNVGIGFQNLTVNSGDSQQIQPIDIGANSVNMQSFAYVRNDGLDDPYEWQTGKPVYCLLINTFDLDVSFQVYPTS